MKETSREARATSIYGKTQTTNEYSGTTEENITQPETLADAVISASERPPFSSPTLSDLSASSILPKSWWSSCFPYRSQPVSVQRSLHRKQMLRHLSDHNSLKSNKYDTAPHDDHVSHILRATSINKQRRQEKYEFLPLPAEAASTVCSSRPLVSTCACTMSGRTGEILSLTQKEGQEFQGFYFPGLQIHCARSARDSSGRRQDRIHQWSVDGGSTNEICSNQARHQSEKPINTSKDACHLAKFNLLPPFCMYNVNSWSVEVYWATWKSRSGLSTDFTVVLKIGFYKTRDDSFFRTSSPGNVSSINTSSCIRVIVSK